MEMQQLPGRIRIHASWIMAEMQGKVANGDPAVRLVRTISPTIYPRNQGYVANGELPASPIPAAFLPTIYPRNQGHLHNGERFPSPGSGCQLLEQDHYLVYRWAMQ
tara:strand:- start:242 stop:559 length:318 start_codon:yes stop_codon:yes gene_type:complete